MSKEQYDEIIKNLKLTISESILNKITDLKYTELDNYYVIQVYIKEAMKVKEMGEVLSNIEDYARENDYSVFVDFLRG